MIWHPSVKQPEHSGWFLVFYCLNQRPTMAHFKGTGWSDSDCGGGHGLVTPDYWMELPRLPVNGSSGVRE